MANRHSLFARGYVVTVVWLLPLFFVVLACAPSKVTPIRGATKPVDAKFGIWGGSRVVQQDLLFGRAVALMKANGFPFCTGSYIGGNQILTAAHCVSDTDSPAVYVTFDLTTPTDLNPVYGDRGPNSPNARKVTHAILHPKFDRSKFSNQNLSTEPAAPLYDIAILRFEGSVPLVAKAAELVPFGQELYVNSDLTLAGYGRSDADGGDYGRLYSVTTKLGEVRSQSKEIVDGPNFDKGSCVGDSGGPVFTADNFNLTGIVSYGPADCGIGKGFNTDLRYLLPWIEENSKCFLTDKKCADQLVDLSNWQGGSHSSFVQRCKTEFLSNTLDHSRDVNKDSRHTLLLIMQLLEVSSCEDLGKLVSGVQKLNLAGQQISDISWLQYFVGLKELDLSFNPLASLKELAYLQKLRRLNLEGSLDRLGPEVIVGGFSEFTAPNILAPYYLTKTLGKAMSFPELIWLSGLKDLTILHTGQGAALRIPTLYSDGKIKIFRPYSGVF